MEKKKWLKPLIAVIVIIAVIAAAAAGINSYLASRSVQITADDVMATVITLKSYIVEIVVVIVLAIVVAIAVFKLKQPLKGFIRWEALIAAIVAIAVIANTIVMGPEYGILNNTFGDQYYLTEETIAASEQLVQDIADEGIVLLKNEDNALPLSGVKKLNVFGWSSTNPIYGGTGSGSVDESTCISLLRGLEDAGFELNTTISDFYTAYQNERPYVGMGGQDWTIPEPTMDEYDAANIFENAKAFSDTAVIVIARTGGENADLPTSILDEDTFEESGGWSGASGVRYSSNEDDIDASKSYLELSNREIAMVERVTSEFENVIVVINSANAMELGFLDEYDSIKGALWMAGPGQTGFESLGRILNGEVNPSGKLVDTYVYDLHNIPAINYVGSFVYDNMTPYIATETAAWLKASFNNYVESIYVGYKFYETAAEEGLINYEEVVQYPFGYGLSYTEFEQEITELTDDGTDITVEVSVENVGTTAGKSVVEVYYNPPYTNGGIEKSSVNLIDFAKTDVLAPGEKTSVSITFAKEDMASYDYSGIKAKGGAYVLEEGAYEISIRSDSHTVLDSEIVTVDRDMIYNEENDGARQSDEIAATNQFDFAIGDGVTYLSRADGFANYAEAVAAPVNYTMSDDLIATFYSQNTFYESDYKDPDAVMPTTGAKNGLTIQDMVGVDYDDEKWDQLMDQLTVEEMNNLIGTGGYASAKIDSIGMPATIECDGPAAIKNNYTGQSGTAFPAATMLAATWSKELATRRGEMMGQQCQDMNVVGWYGPAMNIHRTAFSGRNFEYYSEDGVLSGWMGACEVAGAKEYNVQAYIKHFALNDSEINRKNALCTWTNEQAMREIYLKSFEISVKVGGADNAMTAFNYIGGTWAGACKELLQTVLRGEWGFVGSTVSDWFNGSTDGIMLADAAIRTGGDKMLSSAGDVKAFATNTNEADTVVAMRESCHNILYSIANSNAMDERNFATPGWVKAVHTVDTVLAIVLVLWEALLIWRFLKKRKADAK